MLTANISDYDFNGTEPVNPRLLIDPSMIDNVELFSQGHDQTFDEKEGFNGRLCSAASGNTE